MGNGQIRERARNFFRELAQSRPGNCIWCDVIHTAHCDKEETLINDCAAFASTERDAATKEATEQEKKEDVRS